MSKLLAETCVQRRCETSFSRRCSGIAPCNIKCRNLFGSVETGLKMLLPWIMTDLFWFLIGLHSVAWQDRRRQVHEVVLHGETLVVFTTATVASRCRSRKRFYFSWNLSRNGSSKKFHETGHVTLCNTCWNLFRSTIAQEFQLKVSMCNGGLTVMSVYEILTCKHRHSSKSYWAVHVLCSHYLLHCKRWFYMYWWQNS